MSHQNINFLTAKEVSQILKICYQKALAFIKYSGIDYVRIGRTYRVEEKMFYDFVLNGTLEIDLEQLELENIKKKGAI